MATWIAHLRITENLLADIPGLDAAQFAMGNVAPDSGIPDENWENFDPPPAVTHFHPADKSDYRCADLDFYRHYLVPVDASDRPASSFLLGYFCHLVTDNLWFSQVGRPVKQRFPAEFAADPKFIWTVKDDWYGQDFVYLRAHPQSFFWREFVHCRPAQTWLDFLSLEAVSRNIAHIQAYYQQAGPDVEACFTRPYIYLTKTEMDAFVDGASRDLAGIWKLHTAGRLSAAGGVSALALL